MKDLKKYINESTSINESRYEVDECRAVGNMKYGFMRYDNNRGIVEVIQFNNLKEFAKFEGFDDDEDVYMGIDKLEEGQSVSDGTTYIYTRIW